jgi:hypothetical protein
MIRKSTLGSPSALAREIEAAAQRAVRRALIEHKRAGNPVVFWENGQIRWVPADGIEIPPAPGETPPPPDGFSAP